MRDAEGLIEKIRALPAERVSEVEDFVDFLSRKVRREDALDRLLSVVPALEAAGAEKLTEDDINAEVQAVRLRRRPASSRGGADRS
jgi:hypothetical protein